MALKDMARTRTARVAGPCPTSRRGHGGGNQAADRDTRAVTGTVRRSRSRLMRRRDGAPCGCPPRRRRGRRRSVRRDEDLVAAAGDVLRGAANRRSPKRHLDPSGRPLFRNHVSVHLRAPGFRITEVAPSHEVDPANARFLAMAAISSAEDGATSTLRRSGTASVGTALAISDTSSKPGDATSRLPGPHEFVPAGLVPAWSG